MVQGKLALQGSFKNTKNQVDCNLVCEGFNV